jgi:hypothetical protein
LFQLGHAGGAAGSASIVDGDMVLDVPVPCAIAYDILVIEAARNCGRSHCCPIADG